MTIDDTTDEFDGRDDADDSLIRDRIREHPRPALIWGAGAAILVLLELGHLLGGVLAFGSAIRYAIGAITGIPGWVGGNVGDSLGTVAGAIANDIVAICMLFVVATLISWYVLPWRIVDRLDYDGTRRTESYLELVLLTAVLTVGAALFVFTPLGSLVQAEVNATTMVIEWLSANLPTLTSPETIPNEGHRTPDGGWEGTFLGLSPAWAWALRVFLVFAYAGACVAWVWKGYNVFREEYRKADWTPRDDTIKRFRGHYWGMFGLVVVIMFVVLAAWAPAIAPADVQHDIYESWTDDAQFQYLNEDGELETVLHGEANLHSQSDGQNTVGPMSYDDFDRWKPLGTTPNGSDMLTSLAFGARTSLIIALVAIGGGGMIGLIMSLVSSYYKGLVDLLTVITSDTIMAVPAFLLVLLLSVIFSQADHPLADPLDGGLLLALILAFTLWPGIWRAIRGPALQVSEEEWVDAAKSYGQKPSAIMHKHMAPYVIGYFMIYASMLIGSTIIIVAALSFLGLGITHPTPEWGRLIDSGEPYIDTGSWHVATIAGLMIVIVVLAFNALGDGIRDAIDPEADIDRDSAAAGGGG